MSNLIPDGMTYAELATILEDMAARVRDGDSWEGHIEYLMPDLDDSDGETAEGAAEVLVRGAYRTGNTAGQGGMRMIGSVPVGSTAPGQEPAGG